MVAWVLRQARVRLIGERNRSEGRRDTVFLFEGTVEGVVSSRAETRAVWPFRQTTTGTFRFWWVRIASLTADLKASSI